MRKFMMLGALVAVVVAALAIPALAQPHDLHRGEQSDPEALQGFFQKEFLEYYFDHLEDYYGDRFNDVEDEFFGGNDYWGDDHRWDDDWRDDWRDWREDNRNNNNDEVVPAVTQDFQQQAESGDVNQSFNVGNTGDNSNQCAGIQGVANTGNAQNQVGVIQYGSEADDFDFEDVGSTITVSPSNSTSCDQRVNQAASASS